MPFSKTFDDDDSLQITSPPCIHLRSKAMYVTGSIHKPDHPDEEGSQYCWCNMTQHIIGPDRQDVSRPGCISGRACFRESYE